MTPATLAARGGLAPAPPQPAPPSAISRGACYAPGRPGRPCGHCGAPQTGHGVRYAALAGAHEWTPEMRLGADRIGVTR
ncbi:hypothetical protein [Nocardiopsis composta]|uniref:Uncharacterized protein n=1 Tax=Nocardiopsis composta TaxID=157465 RepID=A0A7W8QJ18_9ACTN|nr:hypothetical protein [Nocardiopsis composta]MBB5431392.1 hypothetical protein [Nocardiopsis composta]